MKYEPYILKSIIMHKVNKVDKVHLSQIKLGSVTARSGSSNHQSIK
jgi:hypothetical protein